MAKFAVRCDNPRFYKLPKWLCHDTRGLSYIGTKKDRTTYDTREEAQKRVDGGGWSSSGGWTPSVVEI